MKDITFIEHSVQMSALSQQNQNLYLEKDRTLQRGNEFKKKKKESGEILQRGLGTTWLLQQRLDQPAGRRSRHSS